MKNIKVVFIDWHQTLSYKTFWHQLQNKEHKFHSVLALVEQSLFVKNKALINPWMRGEYTAEEICQIISDDTGVDVQIIFEELKKSCENMSLCLTNITTLIKRLQNQAIKVVIATDNMDVFTRFTIPSLQLDCMFDTILNSAMLGVLKKDINNKTIPFFDSYLKEQKLTYDDALLLDDSKDMPNIYKQLGFLRIVITSPNHLQEILETITK